MLKEDFSLWQEAVSPVFRAAICSSSCVRRRRCSKVSGKRQLLSLTIDKDAVDPEEVEMLQDMIVAAVNDALKKGEETRESEMSKIGGAGMGGMF